MESPEAVKAPDAPISNAEASEPVKEAADKMEGEVNDDEPLPNDPAAYDDHIGDIGDIPDVEPRHGSEPYMSSTSPQRSEDREGSQSRRALDIDARDRDVKNKVFVTQISLNATENEVRELFSKDIGTIVDFKMKRGRVAYYCIIGYDNEESYERALAMDNRPFLDDTLCVQPKQSKPPRRGGRDGRRQRDDRRDSYHTNSSGGRYASDSRRCYICNEPGHISHSCPVRRTRLSGYVRSRSNSRDRDRYYRRDRDDRRDREDRDRDRERRRDRSRDREERRDRRDRSRDREERRDRYHDRERERDRERRDRERERRDRDRDRDRDDRRDRDRERRRDRSRDREERRERRDRSRDREERRDRSRDREERRDRSRERE